MEKHDDTTPKRSMADWQFDTIKVLSIYLRYQIHDRDKKLNQSKMRIALEAMRVSLMATDVNTLDIAITTLIKENSKLRGSRLAYTLTDIKKNSPTEKLTGMKDVVEITFQNHQFLANCFIQIGRYLALRHSSSDDSFKLENVKQLITCLLLNSSLQDKHSRITIIRERDIAFERSKRREIGQYWDPELYSTYRFRGITRKILNIIRAHINENAMNGVELTTIGETKSETTADKPQDRVLDNRSNPGNKRSCVIS